MSDVAQGGSSARRLVADPAHGPLPALMLALTVVTGLVDAVSILSLGRVFVANMTGNVVFVGFALAGAAGFSLPASLSALAGFLVGAAVFGTAGARMNPHRGHLLTRAAACELVLLVAALLTSIGTGTHPASGGRDAIAALLALAMGMQNAAVRQLKVFDLTTTVLTMTLTGIAADVRQRDKFAVVRRVLAVLTMFAGAVTGTLLVLHVSDASALGVASGLLAVVLGIALAESRSPAPWHAPRA